MTGYEQLINMRFPCRADQLQWVRRSLRTAATTKRCNQDDIDALVVATVEACMNIIQHGYGHNRIGEVILEMWHKPDEIVLRLNDFADTIDPTMIKSRQLDDLRPGGLGVHFMHELMDEVHYIKPAAGVGNILELRKKLLPPNPFHAKVRS